MFLRIHLPALLVILVLIIAWWIINKTGQINTAVILEERKES